MIPSWAATAAAVLAVGTLVQSPRPKMFGNLKSYFEFWIGDISTADPALTYYVAEFPC